ncbi:MAG: hypothetical protein P8I03_15555 [Thalassotalea sp.]|nr:hypothetical protein [Thalassotalea sp.]
MSNQNMKLALFLSSVLGANAVCAQDVATKYHNDQLGKEFVKNLTVQLKAIKDQVALMEESIAERQNAIDYINSENDYQFFTVKKGSFKKQLSHFADRLQIKTIRWSGVPECVDWSLDATYQVELNNAEQAIDEFLDGMPLTYQYSARDNSLNLTSTVIIQGCPSDE